MTATQNFTQAELRRTSAKLVELGLTAGELAGREEACGCCIDPTGLDQRTRWDATALWNTHRELILELVRRG